MTKLEPGLGKIEADAKLAERAVRRRSIAIALALGVMVMLFYAATLVRLGGNVVAKMS